MIILELIIIGILFIFGVFGAILLGVEAGEALSNILHRKKSKNKNKNID